MSKAKQLLTYSAIFLALILTFALQPKPTEAKQSPQQKVDAYNAIQSMLSDINDLHLSEYVGVKVDEEEVSVDLWISSEPSKELWNYLQQFDVRGKGMPFVRLHRAPYTLARLTEATNKVSAIYEKYWAKGGVVLSSAGPRQDGEGLDLTIDVSSATPDIQWISNLENYLGVPVFVNPVKTDITLL